MRDHDDRHRQDANEARGRGWRGEDDDTQESHGYSGAEGRSWEPPYGDERTYGRQGQRGGSRFGEGESPEGGRYPRGGGTYGQHDDASVAQRSSAREGYRYGGTGQAGGGGGGREQGAGGQGGYSGYGSSGQGQTGPGGFPRGGYGSSGYGGDYGQDPYGGGEYIRQSGIGQHRPGEAGYARGDLSAGRGYEGVYGEGAGRSGGQGRYGETQGSRPIEDYEAYAGGGGAADDREGQHHDFDPDYLQWRRGQLESYDRDYHHWRSSQAQNHDDEYRRWRDERRQKFHEDFHGWRQSRSGPGLSQSPISPSTSGVSYTGESPSGGGATSGFATHEVSGATNADMSGATSSGRSTGFTGEVGGASGQRTQISGGEGGEGGASSGPGITSAAGEPIADNIDPAIQNIADGGEGRADLHKDEDRSDRD